jgi:hypothetical protein
MAELTPYEQYLLELINRARLDPAAEAARYGVSLGTITPDSKQPLAPNPFLATAAQGHSQWMVDTDTFSHTGAGGSSPGTRMSNAGYVFSGSWSWGENISWQGTTGTLNLLSSVDSQHAALFRSQGHRENMLNAGFKEVGVGIRAGVYKGYNAAMTTEDFAASGTGSFLTGVAYTDSNGNNFYTPGEGRGGVSVALQLVGGGTTTTATAAAGGYQSKLAAGSYNVTFSGGGLAAPVGMSLDMAAKNIKLDLIGQDAVASSASLVMGNNLKGLTLLGTEDLSGTGNTLANNIVGKKGANQLDGRAGADTLTGGAGNDVFIFRAGEANGDSIIDFTGNGTLVGDSLRFEGYATGGTLTNLGGNQWQVSDGVRTETITINGAVNPSDYSFVGSTTAPPPPPPPPPPTSDPVTGTAGNDVLNGSGSANLMGGGAGNDKLYGNGGNDTVYGGDGNDLLKGGSGNDSLIGGAGADSLTGNTGADMFVIRSLAEGGDRITDFSRSSGDRLDLADLFDSLGYNGTNPVTDGYLRAVQSGSSVNIQIDSDGGANSFVTLVTLQNVSVSSLGTDYYIA